QGTVYRQNGDDWTPILEEIYASIIVTPSRVIYGYDDFWYQYSRATGMVMPLATPNGTRTIATTGNEELFALASSQVNGSVLYRLVDDTWTPVRIPVGYNTDW